MKRSAFLAAGFLFLALALAGLVLPLLAFFVCPAWLQAALALMGLALATWLYRAPSRDRA